MPASLEPVIRIRFQLNFNSEKRRFLVQREAKLSKTVLPTSSHSTLTWTLLSSSTSACRTHCRWIKAWHIASCQLNVRFFHGPGRVPTLRKKVCDRLKSFAFGCTLRILVSDSISSKWTHYLVLAWVQVLNVCLGLV